MSGAGNNSALGGGTIWAPRRGLGGDRAAAGGGGAGMLGGGGGRGGGRGGRGQRGMNPAQREAMQRRMAAGRGRGRGGRSLGRGGQQQQQLQQQPVRRTSYLEFFTVNEWTKLKIMSCLTEEERKVLGSVYPMFKPRELTPQQKKMMEERQEKIALAKKAQEERKAAAAALAGAEQTEEAPTTEGGEKNRADKEKVLALEEERISEEERKLAQDDGDAGDLMLLQGIRDFKDGTEVTETTDDVDDDNDVAVKETIKDGGILAGGSIDAVGTEVDEESKAAALAAAREAQITWQKAQKMQQDAAMAANLTDPHTLLARLNTKRLYRRIRYLQRSDEHFDVTTAYPLSKTTEQIAIAEWQDILNEYTERHKKLWKERQEKEAEEKRLEVVMAVTKEEPATEKEDEVVVEKRKANEGEEVAVVSSEEASEEAGLHSLENAVGEVSFQSVKSVLEGNGCEGANETREDDDDVVEAAQGQERKETDVTKNDADAKDEGAKDEKKYDEQEEVNELPKPTILTLPSKCELLMFSPCPRAVAVLASYPRSGNSLLRTLYERTTLRVSGSDMRGGLQKHDLVGEAATQTNCVQFVKTHYPERMGAPPFRVDRAVLLVRNPYDAMESYFNLMTTNTHTSSLGEEDRKKHEMIFANMAKKEILVWRDFHEYWLSRNIPLLVIRYEDLIRYTDKVIAKVIKFVLEIKSMKFFEERIDRCIREEQIEKLGSYKPRSGGIGRSLSKGVYSPKLLSEINCGIMSTMEKFGYTEMLVPNPSEWKLEPLDQLGVELLPTERQPLVINHKGLVRNAQRNTDWRAVKRQMEMKENQQCMCAKCRSKGNR